jgi:GTP-binding protein Era
VVPSTDSCSTRRWAIEGVDAALLVVDAAREQRRREDRLPPNARSWTSAHARKKPVVLAINKVDTVKDKPSLFPILKAWQEIATFAALVPVSAARGRACRGWSRSCASLPPEGPPLYAARHADGSHREIPGRRADSRAAVRWR